MLDNKMLSTRSKKILQAVVTEFIKTGKPISSKYLYEHYKFGIKPAMIRNEFLNLDKAGYLKRNYYSSGRVPTDKGYEFFIKCLLEEKNQNCEIDNFLIDLFKKMVLDDFIKKFSKILGVLGILIDFPEKKFVYKGGLEYLIDDLEWEDKNEIKFIIRDFENIEEKLSQIGNFLKEKDFIKFFVGKNPLIRSDVVSVVLGDYEIKNEYVLLLAVGPKRMNYEKAYKIFKGLKQYT
jgi:heat-inducible transcriptional repressor